MKTRFRGCWEIMRCYETTWIRPSLRGRRSWNASEPSLRVTTTPPLIIFVSRTQIRWGLLKVRSRNWNLYWMSRMLRSRLWSSRTTRRSVTISKHDRELWFLNEWVAPRGWVFEIEAHWGRTSSSCTVGGTPTYDARWISEWHEPTQC